MDCSQDASRCCSTMLGRQPVLTLSPTTTRRVPRCGGIKPAALLRSHKLLRLARYLYRQAAATLLGLGELAPKGRGEGRQTDMQSEELFGSSAVEFDLTSHCNLGTWCGLAKKSQGKFVSVSEVNSP